ATVVALAFILPSLLMVWALSVAYVRFGGLAWMQALFYGVGAAVIGIIARGAVTLARATLGRDALLWCVFALLAAATAWTGREDALLVLAAGAVTAARRRLAGAPAPAALALAALVPGTAAVAAPATLAQIFWFFTKAGAFVFGSGLAIVPFLYGGLVQEQRWLDERQFLDAVAVAMITPGPVVITVAFIGYLLARTPGLLVAAAGVFLPVYAFVVLPAPWFRRHAAQPTLKAFVEGVTAAAAGAIAGAALVLARGAIVDVWTALIAAATVVALTVFRVSPLWAVGAAAIAGLVVREVLKLEDAATKYTILFGIGALVCSTGYALFSSIREPAAPLHPTAPTPLALLREGFGLMRHDPVFPRLLASRSVLSVWFAMSP
ncbi:MAG TPA: chromate efflux transporter, partial [Vicinamibacteria bacterium]|nr:chromate efflux transporter [Vicinamibacteria bacterium]